MLVAANAINQSYAYLIAAFGFELEDGTPWTAKAGATIQASAGDFIIGGAKPSIETPMRVECEF